MTKERMFAVERSECERDVFLSDLSGHWMGMGSNPIKAIDNVLQDMDYPEEQEAIVFIDFDGSNMSDKEFKSYGGGFYTSIHKNGKYYHVAGCVYQKNLKCLKRIHRRMQKKSWIVHMDVDSRVERR